MNAINAKYLLILAVIILFSAVVGNEIYSSEPNNVAANQEIFSDLTEPLLHNNSLPMHASLSDVNSVKSDKMSVDTIVEKSTESIVADADHRIVDQAKADLLLLSTKQEQDFYHFSIRIHSDLASGIITIPEILNSEELGTFPMPLRVQLVSSVLHKLNNNELDIEQVWPEL